MGRTRLRGITEGQCTTTTTPRITFKTKQPSYKRKALRSKAGQETVLQGADALGWIHVGRDEWTQWITVDWYAMALGANYVMFLVGNGNSRKKWTWYQIASQQSKWWHRSDIRYKERSTEKKFLGLNLPQLTRKRVVSYSSGYGCICLRMEWTNYLGRLAQSIPGVSWWFTHLDLVRDTEKDEPRWGRGWVLGWL